MYPILICLSLTLHPRSTSALFEYGLVEAVDSDPTSVWTTLCHSSADTSWLLGAIFESCRSMRLRLPQPYNLHDGQTRLSAHPLSESLELLLFTAIECHGITEQCAVLWSRRDVNLASLLAPLWVAVIGQLPVLSSLAQGQLVVVLDTRMVWCRIRSRNGPSNTSSVVAAFVIIFAIVPYV